MSFNAKVLVVLVAAPGDTVDARDTVEREVRMWNTDHCRDKKVMLLPIRWETDAVPELGDGDAQSVINSQLVDDVDIVFGLFHGRLGSPTPRAASGTAEELERSITRGARVHVYFSAMPLPRE